VDLEAMRKLMARLAEPFSAEDVDWRLGTKAKSGETALALAYIDARAATERLDLVMGPFWQSEYHELRAQVQRGPEPEERGDGRKRRAKRSPSIIICRIGLSFDEGKTWIWRSDGSGDTDFEAEKGALSGAFKRAAVKWGIGAYLYGFESPWVQIDASGYTEKIHRSEWPKLRQIAGAALARYQAAQKDGRAFRAPPPDEEPARPGFETAAPPARPAAPARPEPAQGSAPAGADAWRTALDAAADFDALAAAVKLARSHPGHGADFEKAYTDKLIAWITPGATTGAEAIDAVAKFASKVRPAAGAETQRFTAALDKARREARGS